MSKILPLVIAPDPILNQVSLPVTEFNTELKNLLNDMIHTMYKYDGVGLAGVQVGVLKRILVMDVDYEEEPLFFLIFLDFWVFLTWASGVLYLIS